VSEHKTGADRQRSDGEQLVEAFRADIAAGKLPQVSWIVTAADLSEHPTAEPSKGEHVCAKLIEALVDHPEVFAKTVFIINYDEAGGFYDHVLPPMPPIHETDGFSTVSVAGECKDYGDRNVANPGRHPLGLGIRVPAIVVSPWSRGGYVCSEVFDHTSTLRFLEKRFGVMEPQISDWRRSVCGDLTSAFDFANPNRDWTSLALPQTADYLERVKRSLPISNCRTSRR
jgi:phospholipase C